MTDPPTDPPPDPLVYTDISPNPGADADLVHLAAVLGRHGVTRATAHYEGSDDVGVVGEMEFAPDHAVVPTFAVNRFRHVAACYCPERYACDKGGHGHLTLYPRQGLAELYHFEHYEEDANLDAVPGPLPPKLRRRLARRGVTGLTAHFDGYADSGQVEPEAVEPAGVEIPDALWHALEDHLLGRLPGGWEIDEGSHGTFTVDVAAGTVTLDARWRRETVAAARVTRWQWRP